MTKKRSQTTDAVRLRHKRIARSLVETGGDVPAVAAKHGVCEATVYRVKARPEVQAEFWAAWEQSGLTLLDPLIAFRDGLVADKPVINVRTGEVLEMMPDHATRLKAASGLTKVVATIGMGAVEQAPATLERPALLSREEFLALPAGERARVIAERITERVTERVIVQREG